MVTISTKDITREQIQAAVELIIGQMPGPFTTEHRDALTAFQEGNYKEVKRLALLNPLDNYCKALSFLGGAFNPQNMASGNSFTILHESIVKVAELVKERTALDLAFELSEVFK